MGRAVCVSLFGTMPQASPRKLLKYCTESKVFERQRQRTFVFVAKKKEEKKKEKDIKGYYYS